LSCHRRTGTSRVAPGPDISQCPRRRPPSTSRPLRRTDRSRDPRHSRQTVRRASHTWRRMRISAGRWPGTRWRRGGRPADYRWPFRWRPISLAMSRLASRSARVWRLS
jgi:hypothetical protein